MKNQLRAIGDFWRQEYGRFVGMTAIAFLVLTVLAYIAGRLFPDIPVTVMSYFNDMIDSSGIVQEDGSFSVLALLGSKGTTGTQASFMELFGGDAEKIRHLEQDIAQQMGFDRVVPVSGQTYSRKVDFQVLQVLSGIAQSASKFSSDIRLLSHLKEVDEPFESGQIGSSAMAYKRNPMRRERIASLSRPAERRRDGQRPVV